MWHKLWRPMKAQGKRVGTPRETVPPDGRAPRGPERAPGGRMLPCGRARKRMEPGSCSPPDFNEAKFITTRQRIGYKPGTTGRRARPGPPRAPQTTRRQVLIRRQDVSD